MLDLQSLTREVQRPPLTCHRPALQVFNCGLFTLTTWRRPVLSALKQVKKRNHFFNIMFLCYTFWQIQHCYWLFVSLKIAFFIFTSCKMIQKVLSNASCRSVFKDQLLLVSSPVIPEKLCLLLGCGLFQVSFHHNFLLTPFNWKILEYDIKLTPELIM